MNAEQNNVARVFFTVEGSIAHIHFEHPSARNAMTQEMYESLRTICQQIQNTPAIRVAILRGVGEKSFVSGSDIAQFASYQNGEDGMRYEASIAAYLQPLQELSIPTIAVIEGFAIGGGLAIASSCDFRISTPEAKFGVPIAKTLGNCLSIGNLAWLTAQLGTSIVRRMLLLAELISAPELLNQGFILRIYPQAELSAAAIALAQRLESLAPITQKVTKLSLLRLSQSNLPNCDDLIRECYGSADFKAGVAAFLAGENPKWQGQ